MARRGNETQSEALEVVEGVVERMDLKLATVARAGVHFADRKRASETPARGRAQALRQLGEVYIVGCWRRLGQRQPQ